MSSSVAVGDSLQVPNSLSYIREPQHRLIIDLLKLTTTEVVTSTTRIVPPSPSHVSLRSTTDVNNSPADCRPNESESVQQQKRFLLSNGFCCCELAMQTGCIGEELGAGWKLNEINVTSLSTHCLDSRPSPLDWKSESLISVAKSGTKLDSTSFLGKTSSTGKIDTGAVRYSRGYPYQKDAIPFRFQHFEDDVAAMNIDLYRESYTYPSLEDHLKSIDGRSSSPASSVVVPKLLVLGISKPGAGASDIHQPHYNRQVGWYVYGSVNLIYEQTGLGGTFKPTCVRPTFPGTEHTHMVLQYIHTIHIYTHIWYYHTYIPYTHTIP